MATQVANPNGPPINHTAGLYSDMTLDGPEIGTLVIVFDRAKNLPNRKAMGKQNPYCAARLGKEAKKTGTDHRGGQTPRWDQELRFIVHDSLDYQKVKISIFSEDKRTDLVGEAWVDLTPVIIPGGGKSDLWQSLTCKGKYAGEVRIELTYYDERPKPVEKPCAEDLIWGVGGDSSKVKRRLLPNNPANRHVTPDTIPEPVLPGRAKHGPRNLRLPERPSSMPPAVTHPLVQPAYSEPPTTRIAMQKQTPAESLYQPTFDHSETAYENQQHLAYDDGYDQLKSPSQQQHAYRHRGLLPMQQRLDHVQSQHALHPRYSEPMLMQHSHSSPAIPTMHNDQSEWAQPQHLVTDFPDPIPDVDYQYQQLEYRNQADNTASSRETELWAPTPQRHAQYEPESPPPPPPPVHSNSSPAVPQRSTMNTNSSPTSLYSSSPQSIRYDSHPASSPLQSVERRHHPHSRSVGYIPPVVTAGSLYGASPEQRSAHGSPTGYAPTQTPSPPTTRQVATRPSPTRHNISDPYANATTPTRPHPLSQQLPLTDSPPELPVLQSSQGGAYPAFPTQYRSREHLPLMKPSPVSAQPSPPISSQPISAPRQRSSYDIQFPIRAFESSDSSPLSNTQRPPQLQRPSDRSVPARKSLTPLSTPPHSAGAMPYSPDSFDAYNPNVQPSTLSQGTSPHSPYQIRPDAGATTREEPNGPIVDAHGNQIDPSDRLPVHSWAPEPEKKTPSRTYGLGRDRDFGPRVPLTSEAGTAKTLSKDTVVNVRSRAQPQPAPTEPTSFRNKLQKKMSPAVAAARMPPAQPLQERHNFNSPSPPQPQLYDQQLEYSRSAYCQPYEQPIYSGSYAAMSEDALSREISSIDIGSARGGRSGSSPVGVAAPTAYVPVRSHRDRRTLY